MINALKLLALIPARANSKGLPGKNIAPLAGKPLIAWTIAAARESAFVDATVVSTDSRHIAGVSKAYGADVPFMRPAELAMDDTPGIAPLIHACQMLPDYDLVALLQPTSPLRTAHDLDVALQMMIEKQADFLVSVSRVKHHPNWIFEQSPEGYLNRYDKLPMKTERQALSELFAPNGAIYIARIPKLLEQGALNGPQTIAYEMSAENSADIDTAFDLKLCELLISERELLFQDAA